jgi:L-ascorbate metabolism protein UlaG (beta-lactamase superfamily)
LTFAGPKRVNAPGISFDDLPTIDVALVSHGHYDHLDTTTLAALATPHRTRVIAPLGHDLAIRAADPAIAIETFDWGGEVWLARDVKVTLAPMRHWSARGVTDRNKALWASFVIDTPVGRVYHVGDSGYGDGIYFRAAREQHGPFKLAILPIGAYEPRWFMHENHMNPEEAVQAFRDCGAEYALAHHYGTFQMADDGYEAPSLALDAALKAAAVPAARFRKLRPGEVWDL